MSPTRNLLVLVLAMPCESGAGNPGAGHSSSIEALAVELEALAKEF